jgi:hypothetical protein
MNNNIEQKEKIRDWWHSIQDMGFEVPEAKRCELEKILSEGGMDKYPTCEALSPNNK